MINWKPWLSNRQARETPESELTRILGGHFGKVKGRAPSPEEEGGLGEAAQWIREGQVPWTKVQRALEQDTWNPAEGARAIYGPG